MRWPSFNSNRSSAKAPEAPRDASATLADPGEAFPADQPPQPASQLWPAEAPDVDPPPAAQPTTVPPASSSSAAGAVAVLSGPPAELDLLAVLADQFDVTDDLGPAATPGSTAEPAPWPEDARRPSGRVDLAAMQARGWPSAETLSSFAVSDADLRAAEAAGVDLDDYYLVRRTGVGHAQTLDLAATPVRIGNLLSFVVARWSGAGYDEIVDAAGKGMPHVDYGLARARGASHIEALDAWELEISSAELEALKRAGIDRDEIRAARAAGVELRHYAAARIGGSSADEVGEVIAKAIPLPDYTLARHGSSHAEVISAWSSGADLFRYASSRHSGLDHPTAVARAISGPVQLPDA